MILLVLYKQLNYVVDKIADSGRTSNINYNTNYSITIIGILFISS